MSMGDRIKEQRIKKNWTQAELGEMTGLTFGSISAIEAERRKPSLDVMIKLCELFEVSTDYLLLGIETERTISESEQEILEVLRKDEAMTNAVMEFAKVKKKAISFTRSYAAANQNAVIG